MSYMLYYASVFNQNLDSWDVSKVTNWNGMYIGSPMMGHEPAWWHK